MPTQLLVKGKEDETCEGSSNIFKDETQTWKESYEKDERQMKATEEDVSKNIKEHQQCASLFACWSAVSPRREEWSHLPISFLSFLSFNSFKFLNPSSSKVIRTSTGIICTDKTDGWSVPASSWEAKPPRMWSVKEWPAETCRWRQCWESQRTCSKLPCQETAEKVPEYNYKVNTCQHCDQSSNPLRSCKQDQRGGVNSNVVIMVIC